MSSAPPIPRVPLALTFHPHWVGWKQEERDGKPTKVPYQVTRHDRRASTTDPSTWATYEAAKSALAQGLFDGIGWVFGPNLETGEIMFAGIDIDKCIVPIHSDGPFSHAFGPSMVHADARKIVEALASYTELSPSGTGLHILVKATLDGGRNRTSKTPWPGGIEMYDRGRFFTITGNHLAWTPETIEARQTELDELRSRLFPVTHNGNGAGVRHPTPPAGAGPASTPAVPIGLDDAALEEKIRASKQGPKFAELFDRGAAEGKESEADLALCNVLGFWIGPDPVRIDAWFRRSALMREKWDDKRGDTTYGGYTIARALEGRTEFYGQKKVGPPQTVPSTIEGREEAVELARQRAAELLGIEDRKVVGGRSWGEDLEARVEVDISDGTTLVMNKLGTYTAPAKLMGLISFQIGGSPALTQATVNELFRCLRHICEFHEAVTLDNRARDCGILFLQEAEVITAEMVNNQAERWTAMVQLADRDPVTAARQSNKSIAAESIVIDSDGTRYVRASWFAAHARSYATGATGEQILGRMVGLGWGQPGTEGRVKATQPNTKKTLNWAFFTVPEGWEEQ